MLTDENDCSIMDENDQQGWLVGYKGGVGNSKFHLPYSTSVCDTNPSDPCCHPCGQGNPEPMASGGTTGAENCPPDEQDPRCSTQTYRPINDDSMNLRCFNQKQRFGIDLLYPTLRYSGALVSNLITPRPGGPEVPNPLYEVDSFGNTMRKTLVSLAAIAGVPWQDIATPDSLSGDGLTYKTPADVAGQYYDLVGVPQIGSAPNEPFMIPSIEPRPTGAPNPFVPGVAISAPDSTALTNPINGHEQQVTAFKDDLQFACIYGLEKPVTCNSDNADTCDCNSDEAAKNSPLCTGATDSQDGKQVYGKAYPSTRELDVLQNSPQSVLTSACPKTPTGTEADDAFAGYGPAVTAIADGVRNSLANPCSERRVDIDSCAIVEARPHCSCDPSTGRVDPSGLSAELASDAATQLSDAGFDPADFCFCEIPMLKGDELDSCLTSSAPDGAGFCYLDSADDRVNPALLAGCPGPVKTRFRFVGKDLPAADSLMMIECTTGL